jgi:hypothetical protein
MNKAIALYVRTTNYIHRHANTCMLVIGVALLVGGLVEVSNAGGFGSYSEANYQDSLVRNAIGNLFALIEGAFGALIMVVAGLGAIVAAAMGAYRAAVGMLVVAVGAFILRSLVSLFFGTNFDDRNAGTTS